MTTRILKTALAASAALILGAGLALASADDSIKARQACMKANGAAMGGFGKVMKGEAAYDAAAVQKALADIDTACAGWAGWWGADTQKGESAETWAKPEIWSDAAGFEAAGADYGKAIAAVKASTDEASLKAAVPGFGGACKGCHEKFRRPKE